PVFTGAATDPHMSFPRVVPPIFNFATQMPSVPLQTWTATFVMGSNHWVVKGSADANPQAGFANTSVLYTTDDGRIQFTISGGTYVDNDQFTFSIVDYIDATKAKAHQQYQVADEGFVRLPYDDPNWGFQIGIYDDAQSDGSMAIRDNGYLSLNIFG